MKVFLDFCRINKFGGVNMSTKDNSKKPSSAPIGEIRNGSGKKDNSELKTLFKKTGK